MVDLLNKFYTLINCCLLSVAMASHCYATAPNSVAFYYGNDLPIDELQAFDWAVVENDNIDDTTELLAQHPQVFAYVSIGEATTEQKDYNKLPKECLANRNEDWDSYRIDLRPPACRQWLIDYQFKPLADRGYHGFFLDTVDSFNAIAKNKAERAEFVEAIHLLLTTVKEKFPQQKLFLNRGFELLEQDHKIIDGMAAESLFATWDAAEKEYTEVPEDERQWLLTQLEKVKKYNIPIVVIDYVPSHQREKAREIAKKIAALDFIPYVSNYQLNQVGVSNLEVIPRKILMLYDSAHSEDINLAPIHRYASFPLEYLGYIPTLQDINQRLPTDPLTGRYAAIVTWIDDNMTVQAAKNLQIWLLKQEGKKIPIAFLGAIPLDLTDKQQQNAFKLKLDPHAKVPKPPYKVIKLHQGVGYEWPPTPSLSSFTLIENQANAKNWLQVKTTNQQHQDAIAITDWGGYALTPYVIYLLPNHSARWVLNPKLFLQQALKLTTLPVPDVTTENGQRLLITHIDGDGFSSLVESLENPKPPTSGKYLLDKVLRRYRIPTTVSIIQAELDEQGLYPEKSAALIKTAQEIFKLDWVEVASHTFSHPFNWQKLKPGDINSGFNLPVPNYKFDMKQEILGSVNFINDKLANPSKPCRVFLWSGEANPDENTLAMSDHANLLNMNGGFTLFLNDQQSITDISPLGVTKGKYLQIYAPMQNDNIYTHGWSDPFYGFRRVIETFALTDQIERYKPINIYYHFYSASKPAAMAALTDVYDWALAQPHLAIYGSEYIEKAREFYHVVLAKPLQDDSWLIFNQGKLREFRTPKSWPQPTINKNVVGFFERNHDRYIHLGPQKQSQLQLQQPSIKKPYLIQANAQLSAINNSTWTFNAYEPLVVDMHHAKNCQVIDKQKIVQPKYIDKERYRYVFAKNSNTFRLDCHS